MTRADWLLLAAVALLLPTLYWSVWQPGRSGTEVVIRSGDEAPVTLSLGEERQVRVGGRLGDSVIEIHDGKAHFLQSPCTSKICVRSGWLQESGEVAACLPNGVSVTVAGGARRFDAINF